MLDTIFTHIRQFQMIHYLAVFLAVALQIQITLFANGDYLGLRIGLADLSLPLIGLFVLFSLVTKKSKLPEWSLRHMMFWLVALVFVMSLSLFNGYSVNGTLSSWALVNKYIGFFLLLAYLMLGGWIVTNTKDIRYVLSLFMVVFTGFFVLTIFMSMVTLFAQYFMPYPLWLPNYPWDGFMANRNSFMVIFVLSFIFVVWGYKDGKMIMPTWISALFWISLPIFLVFNDSRTGWLASAILIIVFFLKHPIKRIKTCAPYLLLGFVIAYSSYSVTTNIAVLQSMQAQNLLALAGDTDYRGDQKRYIAVEDGLELYQQHNPFIGAGLGSYKPFQIEKRGKSIDIIDFTGLWLLVETGAIGLVAFSGFFIACLWSLYRAGYAEDSSSYHRAMFTFLILFVAMSVLHELMYTRILWFAVGLALGRNVHTSVTKR